LQGGEERLLYLSAFPCLLLFSIVGNSMNVILYQQPPLNSNSTIRLLLFRAIANFFFPISLLPNLIYALHNSGLPLYEVNKNDDVEQFYWFSLKYMSFASNVLNTVSVW
jgi:hypothetical protein